MALVTEVHQCPQPFVHDENNVCASSAITAGWTAISDIFLSTERHHSITAVSTFYKNLYLIDKHLFSS